MLLPSAAAVPVAAAAAPVQKQTGVKIPKAARVDDTLEPDPGVLQCVVLRCGVCCSMLQCAAVCRSVLQCVALCCSVLQCVAVCCSVLQCVAVCCSVLQCVAVYCSV